MWLRDAPNPRGALLVGHRGGAALCGGDVLAGTERLIGLRFDMVEIDVRMTGDGVLVVHHDARLASGAALRATRYADLGREPVPPPALSSVLEVADGRIRVDVEIKEPGHEEAVVRAVRDHAGADDVVVTSFHDAALAVVKRLAPDIATGLLVGRRRALARDVFPFRRLRACGADFLAPHHALLLTGLARRAERHGVGLLVWTVNDAAKVARYLGDPRVRGVVTDLADAVRVP